MRAFFNEADRLSLGSEWVVEFLGDALFLARSETAQRWIQGPELGSILPLLDGSRDFETLHRELDGLTELKLRESLEWLDGQGLLAINELAGIPREELAYRRFSGQRSGQISTCRITALDDEHYSDLADCLADADCQVTSDAGFPIVLCRNYLDSRLESFHQERCADGIPWMLVRPNGSRPWIGPIFSSAAGCWYCLAWWLTVNGWSGDAVVANRPAVTRAALQMAAIAAGQWLTTGTSTLTGAIAEFDAVGLDIRYHRLLGRPGCPYCQAPVTGPVPLADTISALTGITSDIGRVKHWPGLTVCSGELSQTVGFHGDGTPYRYQRQPTFGVAETEERARFICLAEGVERYSARFQGDERILAGNASQIGFRCVTPAQLNLASTAQAAELPQPPADDERIGWFECRSLASEERWYLPAGHVFLGYDPARFWADTNGVAAGESLADAAFRALLELIERDAVSAWWYNRAVRPALDWQAIASPRIRAAMAAAQDCGKQVHILDVTTDFGIPVYVAVAAGGAPGLALGCAAHPEPETCAWKALAGMSAILARLVSPKRGFSQWLAEAEAPEFPHLIPCGAPAGPRSTGLPTLDGLVDRARELGLNVFLADLTRPEIGISVARVVVPGLRPLRKRLAPGRLYDLPVKLGWIDQPRREQEMNPKEFGF